MGGPWTIPTNHPFIKAHDWGRMIAVSYGSAEWVSRSYSLWIWKAE